MASPPRITILGSLNIDLVARVPHHPLPGETLTASSFNVSPGGKGANQAVACAKLSRSAPPSNASPSASVSMVGAVGSDSYGSLLRENLKKHGVDVEGVKVREGEKTGIAIIVVDEPTGENRIVLSGEANHEVTEEGVGLDGVLEKTDLLIMQLEVPVGTVLAALEGARTKGVEVLFNPAPAQLLPEGWLKGLGHLLVNETEAALLGGVAVEVLDDEAGCERVARGFVEKGAVNVIITLGGRGVYYLSADGRKGLLPAEKAKVVDTTAAGDTFAGQYALEVVGTEKGEQFDIDGAVRKANRAAAKTVQRKGAQDSIPWRGELV